ncbi:amidohydrolase [Halalkalibaculum sp. DA3122]|uniref:amidohydrolase n=1 Tax=Halalkalibaculum sp. DA3122 TaxID=3373607 RepID=UPI003754F62F
METLAGNTIEELTELRHELHRLAELSGEEYKTSNRIRRLLEGCAPDRLLEGIGGEGIIAVFEGSREGPRVMIRCELDALPIPEENEISYRSKTEGVAHKCGHDGHMAIVAGVARYLQDHNPRAGEVHLLFQPAEETGQGAARVLDDHKFRAVEPDFIFALHNLPGYPLKQVLLRDGVFASASRGYEVILKGETAHAAHPERGRSPAMALATLIQQFSAFPQFYASLDQAAKATVIHSKLGEVAFGTSPGYAEFRATLRTYENELMEALCERAEDTVSNIAQTYGLQADTRWTERFEATRSDTGCNAYIEESARRAGLELTRKETPFAWSEDFGRFTSRYKGAIFGLGAGVDQPPLHAGSYDFPDALISPGVSMFIHILNQITGFEQ